MDVCDDEESKPMQSVLKSRQLIRKLKGVTGYAPNVFIRDLRLK
jgi:hypothetical protein